MKAKTTPKKTMTPAKASPPAKTAVAVRHHPQTEAPLAVFRRQMDDLFSEFLGLRPWGDQDRTDRSLSMLSPKIEVSETEDAYRVTAELPGLDEKDVDVLLEDQCLIIRGEKNEEKDEKRKNYHLTERRYGTFQRAFTLPPNVNPDKITAGFKKGVLHVTVPKTAGAKPARRQVPVKRAE